MQSTILGNWCENAPAAEGSYDVSLGFPFLIIMLISVHLIPIIRSTPLISLNTSPFAFWLQCGFALRSHSSPLGSALFSAECSLLIKWEFFKEEEGNFLKA